MKTLVLTATVFASTCFGALSPFYQSSKEIKELLDSQFLRQQVTQISAIEEILLISSEGSQRIYRIRSGSQTFIANLTYINTPRMGPRQFEINWELVDSE